MELIGDIARKVGPAGLLRVEAEKSRRAARIGAASGLFRVPALLAVDEERGVIEFERVRGLSTLLSVIIDDHPDSLNLAGRAGRALAVVHRDLRLPTDMRRTLPSPWMDRGDDEVFLHGDYTSSNVCIDRQTGELVIVDWSAAPAVGRRPTLGPPYFDVAFFVRHLMMNVPWRRTLSWPGAQVCDQFVGEYIGESGAAFDLDAWKEYSELLRAFAISTIRQRGSGSLVRRPLRMLLQLRSYRKWTAYWPNPELLSVP